MGMFDYVSHDEKCVCGNYLEFQSKDGDCQLISIPLSKVNSFYSICGKCKRYIHYKRKIFHESTINDFEKIT